MKYILYIFFLLFVLPHLSFSQTYFFEIKQMEFKNYRNQEKKLNSELYKNRAQYAEITLSQPIIFRRTNTGFNPNPIIMYFFTSTDSIVRRIHLEIDSLNYLPQTYHDMSGYKENMTRLNDFNKEYEIIRNELVSKFGNPKETQSLKKQDNYYSRKDKWNNDSLDIDMYLTFCGPTNSANRIRANIDFKFSKDLNLPNSFEPNSNPKQDSISQLYLTLIFQEDYKSSWEFLDNSLKEKIPYQEYVNAVSSINKISKNFKEKKVSLFFTGNQFTPNGMIPFYSYKFNSDRSTPPKTLIDVMFKDNESLKIINVIPKQMDLKKIKKLK